MHAIDLKSHPMRENACTPSTSTRARTRETGDRAHGGDDVERVVERIVERVDVERIERRRFRRRIDDANRLGRRRARAPGASWRARERESARWMDDDDARRSTRGAGEARGGDAGVRERDSRGDEG